MTEIRVARIGRIAIGNLLAGMHASPVEWAGVLSITKMHDTVDFSGPHWVVPIADGQPWPLKHQFDILRFICDGLTRGHVLIHCDAGISRSSSAAVLYFMACGLTQDMAVDLVKKYHPEAMPSNTILQSLAIINLKCIEYDMPDLS